MASKGTKVYYITGNHDETMRKFTGFHAVVCGHIHQPEIGDIESGGGKVTYMNSGDWIENLSTLEFHLGIWKIC